MAVSAWATAVPSCSECCSRPSPGPTTSAGSPTPSSSTLAVEIRQFIVDAVTRTGGHLGSNLGAVELTLAVHRVFDSPRDILLWDTGHQAYVHKIVTGRARRLRRPPPGRRPLGLPEPGRESEHDWIENSHASTIVSYAHGLATAQEMGATPADDRGVAPAPSAASWPSSATAR